MRSIATTKLIVLMICITWISLRASVAAAAPAPTDWPLEIDVPAGHIECYQPQPESFEGDQLAARAAVSWTPAGTIEPYFGAMWFTTPVSTDRDLRRVTMQQMHVTRVRLSHADKERERQFAQLLEQDFPKLHVSFPMDQLVASLDLAKTKQVAAQQLGINPPRIIFSTVPATLVTFDGPAKLESIKGSDVQRVANTPFIVLWSDEMQRFYLKAGDAWVGAPRIAGPWHDAIVPPAITAAAAAIGAAPAPANAPIPAGATFVPPLAEQEIIVATTPTELIVTAGPPVYTALPGNELSYVSNTESNVFLDVPNQQNYVLLSGRWYRSGSLTGPWQYVPADKLPAMFARIPADSPKADVLTFVAGTMQSKQAILDASIPQTAVIRRDAGASLKVTYDGPPEFAPVAGTTMTFATNTSDAVLHADGAYYCCHEAAWYQASAPHGPWAVCTSIPAEIHTIPPSCPIYSARYVYIYDATPTTVTFGYLNGYVGSYIDGPTIVYGTGYVYPTWDGAAYIARPWTYGVGASFDVAADTWDMGLGYGWGPGWFDREGDRGGWWGAEGYRDYRAPHAAVGDRRDWRPRANIYNRIANAHRNANVPGEDRRIDAVRTSQNNVFAGSDGKVYRRTSVSWERRGKDGWSPIDAAPEASANQPGGLAADHDAREIGVASTMRFGVDRR
ncbi:MAG: hypothetical protein QOF78_2337 [Phycisphaerales bacterium]|jgi:hypothetical protein|nr:hypothetical protein [Phycisphaerales bacterium]